MDKIDNEILYKLYLSKKNYQIPLVRDRGFILDEEDTRILDEDFMYQDFEKLYREKAQGKTLNIKNYFVLSIKSYDSDLDRTEILGEDYTNKPRKFLAYYCYGTGEQLKEKDITIFINELYKNDDKGTKYSEALFITNQEVNIPKLRTLNSQYTSVTFKKLDYAVWNPTEHGLSNKHTKLSVDERAKFIKDNFGDKASIKSLANKMPRILQQDPIVSYIGALPSDVFRILKDIETDSICDAKYEYRVAVSGMNATEGK